MLRVRVVVHATAFLAVGALLAAGCGDDADSADAVPSDAADQLDPTAASAPLLSALDAPAAAGSGLDEPPGPADRRPLEGNIEFDEVAIAIVDESGTITGWCVLLAETSEQRRRGLMEVVDLGGYAGMLFVFSSESPSSFYMRNTPMPLSIAWFDDEGSFVSDADMDPCADRLDCPTYPAAAPARFALEVPQGELAPMGVGVGSELRVGGSCAS